MELEKLKASWIELDNRLKKNESLTESLILKMTQNRARRSISKLLSWEIYGAVIAFLVIPFIAFTYDKYQGQFLFRDITLIFAIGIGFIGLIWQVYKIYMLMGVDFAKRISDNIYNVNRYNIFIKREKNASVVLLPILFLLVGLGYAEMNVGLYSWIFLSCLIICSFLLVYFLYKRIYNRNIASILDSLNEIKDVEERD